jgi:hypothetical protein
MIECCGRPRPTPFCPECGRSLAGESSISGLLKHCRTYAEVLRKQLAELAEEPSGNERRTKYMARIERRFKRWKTWGDQLAELIEEADREAKG